jgi:hypothetical protein
MTTTEGADTRHPHNTRRTAPHTAKGSPMSNTYTTTPALTWSAPQGHTQSEVYSNEITATDTHGNTYTITEIKERIEYSGRYIITAFELTGPSLSLMFTAKHHNGDLRDTLKAAKSAAEQHATQDTLTLTSAEAAALYSVDNNTPATGAEIAEANEYEPAAIEALKYAYEHGRTIDSASGASVELIKSRPSPIRKDNTLDPYARPTLYDLPAAPIDPALVKGAQAQAQAEESTERGLITHLELATLAAVDGVELALEGLSRYDMARHITRGAAGLARLARSAR